MDLKQIYFDAELQPVEQWMPGFEFDKDITHCVVVKPREGVHRVVNFCSADYNLQTNQSIVDPFLQEMGKYYEVKTHVKMKGFSQFFIDLIILNKPSVVHKGDTFNPMVRIVNSYDGKLKYQFQLLVYRMVCSNGLTVPETHKSYKLMHTPGLSDVTNYDHILKDVSEFIADMGQVTEKFQELLGQPVKSLESRIDAVIEDTNFPSTYKEEVMMIAERELVSLEGQKPNDWVVYNAFNNILNHSTDLKAKESKKEELDREVFEYLYRY